MKKTFRIVAFSAAAALFCAGLAASYWTDRIELECTIPVLHPAKITIIEAENPEMQDAASPDEVVDIPAEQELPEPSQPSGEIPPSEPPEETPSIPQDKTELPPEIDSTPAPPKPDKPSPESSQPEELSPAPPSPTESSDTADAEPPEE